MNALEQLKRCPDVETLKSALRRLCERFGQVETMDVLTTMHEGTKQAICFLRLDSPAKEEVLMKTLGVGRFGGEVVFVVDLDVSETSENPGPSSQWAEI